jgi:hypothetical protein
VVHSRSKNSVNSTQAASPHSRFQSWKSDRNPQFLPDPVVDLHRVFMSLKILKTPAIFVGRAPHRSISEVRKSTNDWEFLSDDQTFIDVFQEMRFRFFAINKLAPGCMRDDLTY